MFYQTLHIMQLVLVAWVVPLVLCLLVAQVATSVATPTLIQTFTFGSQIGIDSTFDEITVYRDVPHNTCSPTGTYDYNYAAGVCNLPDGTRYLATLLVTITDLGGVPIECSSWLQYETVTPAFYTTSLGRPTTPIANPNLAIYPGHSAYMNDVVNGWNFYLTNATLMNGFTCQRSACKTFIDCPNHELETTHVTGDYYPLCGCACADGVGGAACDVPLNCSGRGVLSGSPGSETCACAVSTTIGAGCQGRRGAWLWPAATALSSTSTACTARTIPSPPTPP